MFDISTEHILERYTMDEPPSHFDDEEAVEIRYNSTDPTSDRDGIEALGVVQTPGGGYLVRYSGFESGYLELNEAGMAELGDALLGEPDGLPSWTVASHPGSDLPAWVPESYDPPQTVACDRCESHVEPSAILEPGESDDRFCPDCWDDIHDRWHPQEGVLLEPPTIDGVLAIRDRAQTDPNGIDVQEIAKFVRIDDPDIQYRALHALIDVIAVRPGAALDYVSLLSERLASDEGLVRSAALYCVADLAEDYPQEVAPFAEDIVPMLSVDQDDAFLEGAIPYVAAVADAEPKAVLDAVPRLAALLQTNPTKRYELLLSLTRIANQYPDAVVPVTDDLLEYIEDETDADDRGTAIAAIGYIAQEYPHVVEPAIPTFIDLLEADSQWLRANASGVLADLAEEYPGQLRLAANPVIDLLSDEDKRARYHATSILARVAEEYPADVESATDLLVEMLEEDLARTRKDACWALGGLRAETARDELEAIHREDANDDVRAAAEWALGEIDEGG